ncbi:SpoIIE family protein phosphatase [Streptomyces sp. MUM 203J]|uniref:PP2C family protein-serine/threonine phosphatase n=1 Tax=Streptomyces sp. MUM 203J TaxID=2791990 RepID=UPI001F03FCA5|nr:SpoIIE family protein phosphatase [Streptomyces sp. MUM 203J]MCH0540337.1 SpoIIE family protein phosphatase [Streptomyces sp. MUM 203J]
MAESGINYEAVFRELPGMVALLTPELVYADVNEEFMRQSGRTRQQLVGRYLFDVFPDNPGDPAATGARNLKASLRRVLTTGERDTMALQRYDVESPERPGEWEERYWSPVNAPIIGTDGRVELLVHRVEEVTELIRARGGPEGSRARVLEAELYTRARELQEVNERLREAHAREREVALALQEAMLPAPGPVGHHRAAVRYRPAVGSLNVCGDWYDLVDLPGDRIGIAVGDVVGHGLQAAGVMGLLRSALSAASRVAAGPAQALEVLGLYARSIEGAENTTAVETYVDWDTNTLTYSSAGHPPPALLRIDGSVEFLDQATDPPLGARPEHGARPQATAAFTEGDTLVLYTDGLIERRREDIDTGLSRLADALSRHRAADPERLADILLYELLPTGGAMDDTALVIVRL